MDLHIMQCLLLEELKLLSQIVFSYFPSLLVGMLEKGFQLPVQRSLPVGHRAL